MDKQLMPFNFRQVHVGDRFIVNGVDEGEISKIHETKYFIRIRCDTAFAFVFNKIQIEKNHEDCYLLRRPIIPRWRRLLGIKAKPLLVKKMKNVNE